MTYSLINKCAKNYYNRTFIVPVIAKNVVTCFFLRHSVLVTTAISTTGAFSGAFKNVTGHSKYLTASRCKHVKVIQFRVCLKYACF